MIFHENRLLADNSHLISCLNFVENEKKISQNLSSAAVVIGALKVNHVYTLMNFSLFYFVETWANYKNHHMIFWYLSHWPPS